jgi:hypothetical protein
MCREPFYGDLPAFEDHVQGHFVDDGQPEQDVTAEDIHDWPDDTTVRAPDDQFQIECDAPGCFMKGIT